MISRKTLFLIAISLLFAKVVLGIFIPSAYFTLLAEGLLLVLLVWNILHSISARKKLNPLLWIAVLNLLLLAGYTAYNFLDPNPKTNLKAVATTASQFLFLPLLILNLFLLNNSDLRKLRSLTLVFSSLVLGIALFELLLPQEIWIQLIMSAEDLKTGLQQIPVSYHLRDFGGQYYRIGSIFLEPITFGFFCAALFAYFIQKPTSVFSSVITLFLGFFSFAKMALASSFLVLMARFFGRWNKILLPLGIMATISSIPLVYDHVTSHYRSMGNHFSGLKNGVEAAVQNPWGNGMGTAGYVVWGQFSKENPGPFQYISEFSEVLNGNESLVGIALYQFGWPFTAAYLLLYLGLLHQFLRDKKYAFAALSAAFLIGCFLSESLISVLVSCFFVLFARLSFLPKEERQVVILDHVGKKAGMDYFTGSLAEAFVQKDYQCTVLSNFKYQGLARYKTYFSGKRKNVLEKLLDFTLGHAKSFFFLLTRGQQRVIVHSFETSLKEFCVFLGLRLLGIKVLAIVHDVEAFSPADSEGLKGFMYKHLCNGICLLNQTSAAIFYEKFPHLQEKSFLIKHGHFLSLAGKESPEKQIQSKELNLLFFGQIKSVKGLDILLNAMAKTQNVRLTIAGKVWQDSFSKYQEIIDQNDLHSKVDLRLRFIPDEERDALFKSADLIVLPYKKIFQSGVLIMAMSYAKAVLASNLPANQEIIEDGVNGFLFESENAESLAAKLEEIAANQETLPEVAKAARIHMEKHYSWEEQADIIIHQWLNQENLAPLAAEKFSE